jgi:methyl-accepting chemotaxis protein
LFLKNLAMSRKFALAFLAVGAIIVAMNGAALWHLADIRHAQVEQEKSKAAAGAALYARLALARVENSYRGFLLSGDEYYVERIDKHQGTLSTQLNLLRELSASEPKALGMVESAEGGLMAYRQQVIDAGKKLAADPLTHAQAVAMVGPDGSADALISAVEDEIDALIEYETVANRGFADLQNSAISVATNAIYAGLAISLIIAIGLGAMLTRLIASPIRGLTEMMGRLAGGDTSTEVPSLDRRDEVGRMAQAVQVFKEAQIDKVRLESEAVHTREQVEAGRARSESEKAREAAEDRVAITALATGLAKLAEGDLTHRIGETFAPKLQQLKTDFNTAISQLQETISTIGGAVSAIKTGTGEISHAADDLSRRTEQQAASLEETAAALDEVVSTVKTTAEGAGRAARVTGEARDGAVKSGEVMNSAISAMAEIEKSSEKISQIIGVIDEIAFQTNLLALNAGVEAARAGEAGKGFAVVASEVRALAQRSAEAAKEIKSLISTSTQQVEQGVGLVGQTGTALQQIAAQVKEMSELVNAISSSAQEQSTALAEVNVAVNQMDQVTQQNAAMVEESTAASHNLAKEADELARLIARFKLGNETATRAAPRPQPTQNFARSAPALKTMSSGRGPATVAKAAVEEDAWEEF